MIYIFFLSFFFNVIDCSDVLKSELSQMPNQTIIISRKSRTLPFPDASTIGILLAIAVPLNLPDREVIFSYNFEANYNSPPISEVESLEGLDKYGIGRSQAQDHDHDHNNKEVKKEKQKHKAKKNQKKIKLIKSSRKRRFLDRNLVFRAIENKLISLGFSKICLLRAICEVASAEYGYNNGVLGDIFHILFTPSASMDDGIALRYYKAEHKGSSEDCTSYNTGCPKSILDFFTVER